MSIKKLSKSKTKSRAKTVRRSAQYIRVITNKNGNVKYDYITKDEAKKHMMQRHKRKDRYRSRSKKTKKLSKQKGGFNDNCKLATVNEKGLNFPGLADISGLTIPDKRGVIFRPNCGVSSYHAMIP